MAHFFLGVIAVGLVMGGKIVMESLKIIRKIGDEIEKLSASTQKCLNETEIENKKSEELEIQVSERKAIFKELEQKEQKMNNEINELRNVLDGGK